MRYFGGKIQVIDLKFRLFHIFLMIGSAFLLYTALGSDDDEMIVSGAFNLFLLHRYAGLIWGTIILLYSFVALSNRRSLKILQALRKPIGEQIRESLSITGRYFFGIRISERVRSNMGRHNVLASYAFLLLTFGIASLGLGGVGLILSSPETPFYEVFLGVHVLGAGMLALFVLAHGFAVINKQNRPLLRAVFSDGKVSRSWAEESMPKFAGDENDSR